MDEVRMPDWPLLLHDQLRWLWDAQLRPRLTGLGDEEYFWEPVPGCWNVRPRGRGVAVEVGSGPMVIDFAFPEPEPPPVTTIAWRLGHLLVGVFGERNARYFDGPPVDYGSYDYPATAAEALTRLDEGVDRWTAGVRALSVQQLAQPCNEPGHDDEPLAALVLHINKEAHHHLAEIALLRDLHRAGGGRLSPG